MPELIEELELTKDDLHQMSVWAAKFHGYCCTREDESDQDEATELFGQAKIKFADCYHWFRRNSSQSVDADEVYPKFRAFTDALWDLHHADELLSGTSPTRWSVMWQLEMDGMELFPQEWKARYK
jgi:hypothetical protein